MPEEEMMIGVEEEISMSQNTNYYTSSDDDDDDGVENLENNMDQIANNISSSNGRGGDVTVSCFSGYSGREYGGQVLDESIRPHELMYFRKYAPIYRRLAAEGHGVLRLKPEDVEYNKKLTKAALDQQAVKKLVKDETTALEDRTRLNLDDNESSHKESSTLSNTEHHRRKISSEGPKNLKKKMFHIVGVRIKHRPVSKTTTSSTNDLFLTKNSKSPSNNNKAMATDLTSLSSVDYDDLTLRELKRLPELTPHIVAIEEVLRNMRRVKVAA
jgi:hypothetical protein